MAVTMNAATFMGKNFSTIQSVVKNHESLALKQMFDVTAQLVNNQEETNGLDKILYLKNSWTHLSLINDEVVINLQSTKVYVFSDSVLCLGKVLQHPESNEAWKNRVAGIRSERSSREYDAINRESTEFEWNIFSGFTTLQLCDKINDLLSNLGQTPEIFTGRILFMSMFNDISCDRKDNKDECQKKANFVKTFAGRFGIGQWSFLGPGSEKKWYSSEKSTRSRRQHCGENVAGICREWTSCFPCNDSIVQEYSQKQGARKNCQCTSLQIIQQLKQFFASSFLPISSVSTEQWRTYVRNSKPIKIDRGNLMC